MADRGVVIYDGVPLPVMEVFLDGGEIKVRCRGQLTRTIPREMCDYQVLDPDGRVVWIGRTIPDSSAVPIPGVYTEVDLTVGFAVHDRMANSVNPIAAALPIAQRLSTHQFLPDGWWRRRHCIRCGLGRWAHAA